MKHRILFPFWLSFLVLVNASIVIVGWLYFVDGRTPVEFKNVPMPVDMPVYKYGDVINVFADYCKYEGVPSTVYLQFVDGIVFDVGEPIVLNSPVGCDAKNFPIIRVPDKLPIGEYYLRGENVYKVNILRSRSVSWKTKWFRVEK